MTTRSRSSWWAVLPPLLLALACAAPAPDAARPFRADPSTGRSIPAGPAAVGPSPTRPPSTRPSESSAPPSGSPTRPIAATPVASAGSPAEAAPSAAVGTAPTGPVEHALVVRVVDGDTIEVEIGGLPGRVRYIGVDTPETVRPGSPVEWMGREASAANRQLVAGKAIVLEKDVSDVDRYQRLLRYVWLQRPDGSWLLVNRELVRLGFAQVVTYPPDVKYVELFLESQREAREAQRGLWAPGRAQPTAHSSSRPAARPTAPAAPNPPPGVDRGGCDPSYPDVCIPPPPPDLDCRDVSYRRFVVVGNDPHRFDGEHDGLGCERGQ